MYNKEQLISWRNLINAIEKTIDGILKLPSLFVSNDNRDMQMTSVTIRCTNAKCAKSYSKVITPNKRKMINLNESKCPLCFTNNSFKSFILNTN